MNDRDLPYAAGFFDGEGCISACRRGDGRVALRVTCTQSDPRPLEWLRERFGGRVSLVHRADPGAERRAVHVWVANEAMARRFLTAVLPYLIVKRERAEMALVDLLDLWANPIRPGTARLRAADTRPVRMSRAMSDFLPTRIREALAEHPQTPRELASALSADVACVRSRLNWMRSMRGLVRPVGKRGREQVWQMAEIVKLDGPNLRDRATPKAAAG